MIRVEQTGREEQNAVDSGFGGYMDTGIDILEIVNLVFFKKMRSKVI